VICGFGGADVLIGKGGGDVLIGGVGNDTLFGDGGRDQLIGNRGRDAAQGGPGIDTLSGRAGDDYLDGGPETDSIDGGAGSNTCMIDGADTAASCRYDEEAPTADRFSFSTDTVDVTTSDQTVTFRLHVTDDTGVERVSVQSPYETRWFPRSAPSLVSGTLRDGWWEGTLEFRAGMVPGTFRPIVLIQDRLTRLAEIALEEPSVMVLNDVPDLENPGVTLLSPGPDEKFELAPDGESVRIKIRVTDAASGVDPDGVNYIVWAPRRDGVLTFGVGGGFELKRGDLHDGIWHGVAGFDPDAVGGRWNLGIRVRDRAGNSAVYWGPDEYPYRVGEASNWDNLPLPGEMGIVNLIGRTSTDTRDPKADSAEVDTTTVDTLRGPATVRVTLHAADAGIGVEGMLVSLIDPDTGDGPPYFDVNPDLVSGTHRDGTWSGKIVLPQGTPPQATTSSKS
jgi:Ca2+-binding RTX toxin-like protein